MTPKPHLSLDLRRTKAARDGKHGTIDPKVFVVHTAECRNTPGNSDLKGVYAYLARTTDKLWVHFAIDGEGNVAQGSDLTALNYHCKGANSFSTGCELIGYASTPWKDWMGRYKIQLLRLSELIAYWSTATGNPVSYKTVKGHYNFPVGGHHDPGKGFPMRRVILDARYYAKKGKHLSRRLGGLA